MIDTLISGHLRGAPSVRNTSTGKPFAIWRMSAQDRTGECVLFSCITFSATAVNAVQRLGDGDAIAVKGEASFDEWDSAGGTTLHSLVEVLVHGVMAVNHLGSERNGSDSTQGDNDRGPL